MRRGVADVATSRKRLELQVSQLEQTAAKLAGQRQDAPGPGNEGLAPEVPAREAEVQERLSALRHQLSVLKGEEERLFAASQRLQVKVDAFRTRKESINASYTADEASRAVREAFASMGEDARDLESPDEHAAEQAASTRTPPAASEIPEAIPDLERASQDDSAPADQDGVPAPPGMRELRPGAPGRVQAGLLFVVEAGDAAILVARVADPGRSPDVYREAMPVAAARLTAARSGWR